ncbi:neurogenic protein mastermind-like [Photinus pyralis]|nr:neurogenic protein mastermind-like [Photinus pyralis]XP_031339869.1 neurogenic protein mastermind-like [Photinus pyralis]
MYFNQSAPNAQQASAGQPQNSSSNGQQNQQTGSGLQSQTNQQSQNVQQPGVHLSSSQLSNAQNPNQGPYGNLPDLHGSTMSANGPGVGMMGAGGMGGSGVIPLSSGHNVGMGGNQHQSAMGDMYSMTQTQTINFTQQSLRQRVNGPNGIPSSMGPNAAQIASNGLMTGNVPMGAGGQMGNTMGPRHMTQQTLEQQKLLQQQQQQQMLRAQQALMQQQMVRPPPPDYKTSAGMMQGMQPRYQTGPPTSRRMPQPMPPSGPMMRSHNMYVMQQQHMSARTMYPRQQSPIGGPDSMPQHGSAEWRHLIMSQQQNANFNSQIRPNFHQGGGYSMNTGTMQMTGLQHQQMRTQGMLSGGLGGQSMAQNQGLGQNPMQMNNINQQMLHMQQQQALMQQQSSNQMSLTNMSMQQSQSLSVSTQSLQHQQLGNHQQLMNNPSNNNQSSSLSNFNPQAADFNLDFLENLPTTDSSGFTEQELLNSFDSDPGFNLQDIL